MRMRAHQATPHFFQERFMVEIFRVFADDIGQNNGDVWSVGGGGEYLAVCRLPHRRQWLAGQQTLTTIRRTDYNEHLKTPPFSPYSEHPGYMQDSGD